MIIKVIITFCVHMQSIGLRSTTIRFLSHESIRRIIKIRSSFFPCLKPHTQPFTRVMLTRQRGRERASVLNVYLAFNSCPSVTCVADDFHFEPYILATIYLQQTYTISVETCIFSNFCRNGPISTIS